MSQVKLSLSRTRELAELAVQEKGRDYQYRDVNFPVDEVRSCVYFEHDRTPSCLVGHMLHYAGINIELFFDNEDLNEDGVAGLCESRVIECDDTAREYMVALQNAQDAGYTWGSSLMMAEAAITPNAGVEPLQEKERDAGDLVSESA